ncbi:MAG: hypothetical protein RL111_1851 [Pseudomonadota bacterium]|jgi:hypothetical protein
MVNAQSLARDQFVQLQKKLSSLAPFQGEDMTAVVVGSWGLQRPSFQILVLVNGEAAKKFNVTQRHQWRTMLMDLTRSLGLGLTWQDVRFVDLMELYESSRPNATQAIALDRPITDALLLLVDAVPLNNPQVLNLAREALLLKHMTAQADASEGTVFPGLTHAIQECWHRLCLLSAVHPEMERVQFGWRLSLHSLVLSLVHLKPNNLKDMVAACEALAMDRLTQVLSLDVFDSSWETEHQLFLEDFQTLMELRSMNASGPPVAMSQLAQRRYNRFFYRLLTHFNVDESLRFTLLS